MSVNVTEGAAAQAALGILARLLQELRDQKVLTPDQLADILNKTIEDHKGHRDGPQVAAIIHTMAGTK